MEAPIIKAYAQEVKRYDKLVFNDTKCVPLE